MADTLSSFNQLHHDLLIIQYNDLMFKQVWAKSVPVDPDQTALLGLYCLHLLDIYGKTTLFKF